MTLNEKLTIKRENFTLRRLKDKVKMFYKLKMAKWIDAWRPDNDAKEEALLCQVEDDSSGPFHIPPPPMTYCSYLPSLLLQPCEIGKADEYGFSLPLDFPSVLSEAWPKAARLNHVRWNPKTIFQVSLTKFVGKEQYTTLFVATDYASHRVKREEVKEELVLMDGLGPIRSHLISLETHPVRPFQFKLVNTIFKLSTETPEVELYFLYKILEKLSQPSLSVMDFETKWYASFDCMSDIFFHSASSTHVTFLTLPQYHEPFAEKLLRNIPVPKDGDLSAVVWDHEFFLYHFALRLPKTFGSSMLSVLQEGFDKLFDMANELVGLILMDRFRYDFCMTTEWMMLVPRKPVRGSRFLEFEGFNSLGLFRCKRDYEMAYISQQDWLTSQLITSYYWGPESDEDEGVIQNDEHTLEDTICVNFDSLGLPLPLL